MSEPSAIDILAKNSGMGDKLSYTKLLKTIAPILESYCRKRIDIETDLEDIVQEILLSIHTSFHTYDPKQKFLPWAYSIAKRRVIDRWRSKAFQQSKKTETLEIEDFEKILVDHSNTNTQENPLSEMLSYALKKLPEKHRAVFELAFYKEKTYAEIASKLNVSESAIKSRIKRGLPKLKSSILSFIEEERFE